MKGKRNDAIVYQGAIFEDIKNKRVVRIKRGPDPYNSLILSLKAFFVVYR